MNNINNFIQDNMFFQISFFDNAISDWLAAILVFFAVLMFLKIFKSVITGKLKKLSQKTKTKVDDMVIDALSSVHWPFYVITSLYSCLFFIKVPSLIKQWSFYIFFIAVVYYCVKFLVTVVDRGIRITIEKRREEDNVGIIKFLGTIIKVILWVAAGALVLDNMGYEITSLIAGLGIGGVAVALALQNILGDLFSSFAIYFDKPFKIGDFIVVGEYMGTVKKIGIKTTRIQALQGEEIVIPNNELTNAKVQNFGVMEKRRVVFSLGLDYNTPFDRLKKVPNLIKEIIGNQKGAEIDRVHFKSFGDFSLIYEVVYYVNSSDYNFYMDVQQKINLDIIERLAKEKIEIAFPTQTLYVKKEKI